MKNSSQKASSTRRMILMLLLLGLGLTWFLSRQLDHLATGARPAFPSELTFLTRNTLDFTSRESPIVVNFWATWCPPCLQELPVLVKVSRDYENQVHFVGFTVDSPLPDVFAMQTRFQIPYPLAVAPWEMVSAWKAEQLPTTYILNKEHEIVWSHRGAVSESDLVAAIATATSKHPLQD